MKRSVPRHVDVLGLGITPFDIAFGIDHFPEPEGKLNASWFHMQGGGPVPNCLVGLSRLGCRTVLIAPIGNDMFGDRVIEELNREQVDTRFMIRKRGQSHLAAGLIEQGTGRRTFVLHRELFVRPADLRTSRYPRPKIVHIDGRDVPANIRLAKWAHRMGAIVTLDIGSVRNDVTPLYPLVDHLVVADAYACGVTGTKSVRKAVERLRRKCSGTVVVTAGTQGSLSFENGHWIRQTAFRVPAIDTTGAGDLFHTGYLYGLLKGWPLAERLRFGSAVAALNCMKPGCRKGAPRMAEVKRFLNKDPETYD